MPTFTLTILEQIGCQDSSELRFLGERHLTAASLAEGKRWLSGMIAENRLESDRFYRFESSDCSAAVWRDAALSVSFYLFSDGRLCPLRIWSRTEHIQYHQNDPEWIADFEGVPTWSLFAPIEPRWQCLRTVPAERSWMGRSRRDWQRRNCYVLTSAAIALEGRAA